MWAVEIIYAGIDDFDNVTDEEVLNNVHHVRGFPTEEAAYEYIDLHFVNRPDILDMYPIHEDDLGVGDFDRPNNLDDEYYGDDDAPWNRGI